MMQDPSTYFNNQFPEHEILKCPRCDSSNTKFCYYNNYNLSQPRHYCKNCKRYWTKGGTLRNIPVGGASRKITKRSSSSTSNPQKPSPTITTTADNPPVSSSPADNTVNNNKNQQQQQQQTFVGTTTSFTASYLIASLYPRMSTGMAGFNGQMGQQSVDQKVEEISEERFKAESGDMNCWSGNSNNDWPELAIYTPGGSAFQ